MSSAGVHGEGGIGPPEAQVGGSQAPAGDREAPAVEHDAPAVDREPTSMRTAGRRALGWFSGISALTWTALAIAAIAAIAMVWIAGEMHYRNCVTAAAVKTQGANDGLTRLVRIDALKNCSHSPF